MSEIMTLLANSGPQNARATHLQTVNGWHLWSIDKWAEDVNSASIARQGSPTAGSSAPASFACVRAGAPDVTAPRHGHPQPTPCRGSDTAPSPVSQNRPRLLL